MVLTGLPGSLPLPPLEGGRSEQRTADTGYPQYLKEAYSFQVSTEGKRAKSKRENFLQKSLSYKKQKKEDNSPTYINSFQGLEQEGI